MPPNLTLPAPGKLNLFLHITGQRSDGYHELQTLFHLLDYGDLLHFRLTAPGSIKLQVSNTTSLAELPSIAVEDNLIYRAAQALQCHREKTAAQTLPPLPGIEIELDKRLPAGGGLGGGSTDAATTLVGLNHLWQLGLSTEQLCQIGLTLGADVPVFVRGCTAWGEGLGDQLTPIELPTCWYVVIKPACLVSTGVIFQHPRLTRNTRPITIRAFFNGTDFGAEKSSNDCQVVTEFLHPEVAEARKWLDQYGSARMTGTGACLFARFNERSQAEEVLAKLPGRWDGFLAKGVNKSPLVEQIQAWS